MYEKTPLSRGEGLDPNPLSPGEFIEHKHAPILCSNGMRTLKMLRVSLLYYSAQHKWHIMALIVSQRPFVVCVFQKAKADPRPVSPPGEAPVRKHKCFIILIASVSTYIVIFFKHILTLTYFCNTAGWEWHQVDYRGIQQQRHNKQKFTYQRRCHSHHVEGWTLPAGC